MFTSLAASALAVLSLASAAPLNEAYYQPRDTGVAHLFRRAAPDPSADNYTSYYPDSWKTPNTSTIPQAWLDKLATVSLPNVSVATANGGRPKYPDNENDGDSTICSFTDQCVEPEDLYEPPTAKVYALSFDDGPSDGSQALYDFLSESNLNHIATHFMIGGNVVTSPNMVKTLFEGGGHLAVHTWSHPYMTTMSNEGVVAELGWTMQAISDLTGGRIPKFWRPPYGDADNRVRAIAKGVFGLETVLWNDDTDDWEIEESSKYTVDSVTGVLDGFLTDTNTSKALCVLEHELSNNTIQVFKNEYPRMLELGWSVMNIADAWGMDWYVNAGNDTAAVTTMSVAGTLTTASSSSAATSAASTTDGAAATGSASGSAVSAASAAASSTGGTTSFAIALKPSAVLMAAGFVGAALFL
ncbi:hypothetical protein IAT38_005345 [Cryptococcus sp. DSM 104549]